MWAVGQWLLCFCVKRAWGPRLEASGVLWDPPIAAGHCKEESPNFCRSWHLQKPSPISASGDILKTSTHPWVGLLPLQDWVRLSSWLPAASVFSHTMITTSEMRRHKILRGERENTFLFLGLFQYCKKKKNIWMIFLSHNLIKWFMLSTRHKFTRI